MSNRIALVDDDQNIFTSIAMALEAEGFQVSTYKDGEAALRGLDQRPVDLAVLDIKMRAWMGWNCSSAFAAIPACR